MSVSGYRTRLRLVEVPREEESTDWFEYNEDEEIVDVKWFVDFVSVTIAETVWLYPEVEEE